MERFSTSTPKPEKTDAHCVTVSELHYSYGKNVEALSGLSFTAQAGHITALLGPNGSGKSTTFKILSTQLTPQKGDAQVFGRSVTTDKKAVREMIGVTFQAPSLDPMLNIEENLRIQAAMYGLGGLEATQRIDSLIKLFRLEDRRRSRVKELSGGLARRAELAKTLLSGPKVLLLDEPTTGLDPLLRFEFWQELRKLRDSGMSIVVTTHLMEEADLCDEILIINKGRLAARGQPSALKNRLGADIIVVESAAVEGAATQLKTLLGLHGNVTIVNGKLRVETKNTDQVYQIVREVLGDRIESLQMGKPTLADVYLNFTGDSL